MTSCQSTYEGKRNQVNNFRRKPNFTSVYICRTTKCYGIITIVDNRSVQLFKTKGSTRQRQQN